ncbi:MAG: TPM domain-containing protein [bacterium]
MRKEHPHYFFSEEEKQALVSAIQDAERKTSGEIRVHLARRCRKDPLEAAKKIFERLGMTRTKQKNGVLFFLSLKEHAFVILGDGGIHEKVGEDFWQAIRDEVIARFKKEEFVEGLTAGILKCGEKLAAYFPPLGDDVNELPDKVSTS